MDSDTYSEDVSGSGSLHVDDRPAARAWQRASVPTGIHRGIGLGMVSLDASTTSGSSLDDDDDV
jgi:hypothetical protein